MKTKPVKGTNDYLPQEVELRDYLQNEILKTYQSYGFGRITTPILEDAENLDIFNSVTDRIGILCESLHDRSGKKPDHRTENAIAYNIHQIGTADTFFYTV